MNNIINITHIASHLSQSSAAYRLNTALVNYGVNSGCCANEADNVDINLFKKINRPQKYHQNFKNIISGKVLKKYQNRDKDKPSDFGIFPIQLEDLYDFNEYDILHLHWVTGGLLKLHTPKIQKKKIVWTFHGVWPLTGGCHINYDCQSWKTGCGKCPQLGSKNSSDLSSYCWQKKKKLMGEVESLTIVTPSRWLANMVQDSDIFSGRSVHVIPNCLDTDLFRPLKKCEIREILQIPIDKKIILFVAINVQDKHKGIDLLFKALDKLKQSNVKNVFLLAVGSSKMPDDLKDLPYPVKFLGSLKDEISLAAVYNAADVFVGPSRQDNLPTTFLEAISCGIPCVGFNIGGIPEIIEHKKSGYLASPFDIDDLANGVFWVLENENRYSALSKRARQSALEKYTMEHIAKKHSELYCSIL